MLLLQGDEHLAFRFAKELLEKIEVNFIFMEWMWMKTYYSQSARDKELVEKMIDLFLLRDFKPYKLRANRGRKLNATKWYRWPDDVVWKKL